MPPPPSAPALPYIANTAAAISLIPTISGAAFLLKPSAGLKQFNLPGPTTEKELGLFQMYACRQCAAGTLIPFLFQAEAHKCYCNDTELMDFCRLDDVGDVVDRLLQGHGLGGARRRLDRRD